MDETRPSAKRKRVASTSTDVRVRPIKSCLQCRSRKVRCDQSRPCRNCVRRKEPDLCQYTESDDPTDSDSLQHSPLHHHQPHLLKLSSSSSKPAGYAHIVHDKIVRPILENEADGHDTFSGLDSGGPCTGAIAQQVEILPRDVMNIYEAFLLRAHQFVPIVLSLPKLAENVCKFAQGGGGSSTVKVLSDDRQIDDGQRALLCIVLASGAQYSDLPRARREELVRFFASSSFVCLRAANFMSKPSPEIIQTLLLHGHLGQNNFRCNAAWSLLGMTIRLASSIGIHQGLYKDRPPPEEEWKLHLLDSIGWQDILLGICIGNVPTVTVERSNDVEDDLNYPSAMRYLCAKTSQILLQRRASGESLRNVLDQIVQAQDFYRRLSSKLNLAHSGEHSTQYLQRIAFRVHVAYTVSYLCKPALMPSGSSANDAAIIQKLLDISTTTLIEALRDYATLLRLTVIAVRSWSLLHNGLGSALMLGVIGEYKKNREVRALVREILDSISGADMHGIASGNEWDRKIVSRLQVMYDESADEPRDGAPPTPQPQPQPSKADAAPWPQVLRPPAHSNGHANGHMRGRTGLDHGGFQTAAGMQGPPPVTLPMALPNDGIDVSDLEGFDTLFTQDWLAGFDQQMF